MRTSDRTERLMQMERALKTITNAVRAWRDYGGNEVRLLHRIEKTARTALGEKK